MAGILIIALVALSIGVAAAQYGQGNDTGGARYVDADGDGECDNIGTNGKDSDGDGTPNGQDEDYVSPKDGSGNRCGYGNGCNR